MHIIVFGASGSIGKEVVKEAIENGHMVTAFIRNPDAFPFKENKNLKIYQGDVLNPEQVENAIKNNQAVICTLGDGKTGKIRAAGTKVIIDAMKNTGVKRLICLSTIGAGDSYQSLNFLWKYIMFGLLLKKVLPDHNLQEQFIRQSSLDYTIVRPGALTNGAKTNTYKAGLSENLKNLSLKISRADVAAFLLRQLQETDFVGRAVSISY